MSLGSVDDVVAVDRAIVTAGPLSATVTLWVAMVDWLPLASVTCADTVAVPLASVVASVEGIVALQVVPAPLPSRYSVLLKPSSVTVTLKVLVGRNPADRAAQRHAGDAPRQR